jgi:hypothetical protein
MPFQGTTPEGQAQRQAQADAGTNPFDALTLVQALAWIDANVTDLASARTALKQAAKMIFIQKRRIDKIESHLKNRR